MVFFCAEEAEKTPIPISISVPISISIPIPCPSILGLIAIGGFRLLPGKSLPNVLCRLRLVGVSSRLDTNCGFSMLPLPVQWCH